jgi:enoyl-CoA hydratase
MAYETILFEKDGGVAIVKFNRPKAMNAINPDVISEINRVLDDIEKDPLVRVLVFTGVGEKAFVAGADIGFMADLSPLEARKWSLQGHKLAFRLEELPIPVIACVNGYALGGGTEMALACDFIYASENAQFGQPEINLGIIPGFGGTQRLARRVGKGMAKELCMSGVMISAQEAQAAGLVNRVFPQDRLFEETMKTARLIAAKGSVSLSAVKHCIDRGFNEDLHKGCLMEVDAFGLCFDSPDAREGMTAFLGKRKPEFKGERV